MRGYRFPLLLLVLQSAMAQEPVLPAEIVGVWQRSSVMPSGWADVYQFFDDGRFIHNSSQMDCATREISRSGMWITFPEVDHWNNTTTRIMVLDVVQRHVWIGGTYEASTGSCGTDSTLIDAVSEWVVVDPPIRMVLGITPPEPLGEGSIPTRFADFGGVRFWKWSDDPLAYD